MESKTHLLSTTETEDKGRLCGPLYTRNVYTVIKYFVERNNSHSCVIFLRRMGFQPRYAVEAAFNTHVVTVNVSKVCEAPGSPGIVIFIAIYVRAAVKAMIFKKFKGVLTEH